MARTFFSLEEIDNTGTLFEEIITQSYDEAEWNRMLLNTKFLRTSILKMVKEFIDSEGIISIKEFSDAPPMIYDDPEQYDLGVTEIETDIIIVRKAYELEQIIEVDERVDEKYGLSIEVLDPSRLYVDTWDSYLDKIYNRFAKGQGTRPRVQKIMIEDPIDIFRVWKNHYDVTTKDMIKAYNTFHDIEYNTLSYWQEPIAHISEKYWKKFSFVMTINDYELYDPNNMNFLEIIADRYFDNGFFDEVVIKMNYFYWHDDFETIINWTSKILGSPLVSFRFDTMFSNDEKNRYYSHAEAAKYGDVLRKNTMDEELAMFDERLPIFCAAILTNPQVAGFELDGGYFGKEGEIPNMTFGSDNFEMFTEMMCKILRLSPFAKLHDHFKIYFEEPTRVVYICIKGREK